MFLNAFALLYFLFARVQPKGQLQAANLPSHVHPPIHGSQIHPIVLSHYLHQLINA
jgi:hypothetical protein